MCFGSSSLILVKKVFALRVKTTYIQKTSPTKHVNNLREKLGQSVFIGTTRNRKLVNSPLSDILGN